MKTCAWLRSILPFALGLASAACGSSKSSNGSPTDGGGDANASTVEGGSDGQAGMEPTPAACTNVVSRTTCDPNTRPIVLVHGTYSSGTDIEHMAALLASNGFCQDRIVAVDYDSVALSSGFTGGGVDSPGVDCTGTNTPAGCGKIDATVNALLKKYPQFTQVDLMGHSQGTFHCGNYLMAHADKIAHYINFSGVPMVGAVSTLSLSSERDLFGSPHHATGNSICAFHQLEDGGTVQEAGAGDGGDAGCNVVQYTFIHQDHFAVAASKDSFVQVYKFLTGKDPTYTDIQCGDDPVMVEGVAETFADNVPINGKLDIREVTSAPRDMNAPTMTLMGDATTGHFGPVMLKRGVPYVFTGYDQSGKLVGWQYFTPFMRDNRLVRLLSPASGSDGSPVGAIVAQQSTDHAVTNASNMVVVARWAQGGFRQDLGASLKVNGTEAFTSDNAGLGAAMNANLQGGIAAMFLEDAPDAGPLGVAYSTSFIAFTNLPIDATSPAFVNLNFTAGSEDPATANVSLAIDNYPSSQGLVAVMFQ